MVIFSLRPFSLFYPFYLDFLVLYPVLHYSGQLGDLRYSGHLDFDPGLQES